MTSPATESDRLFLIAESLAQDFSLFPASNESIDMHISGLLSRAARSVPYERIQDVSVEQKRIPRLFGLVEVKFETGAGGGDDLKLAYLTEAEGDRLRDTVKARREGRERFEIELECVGLDMRMSSSDEHIASSMPMKMTDFLLFSATRCAVCVV